MMMFFSLAQFTIAQVHPDLGGGEFCYCANIYLGCHGNVNCIISCQKACKSKIIKIIRNASNITSFATNYPNTFSQSNIISLEFPQLNTKA